MPDSRKGRDKQARDRDDRQRERAILEELERGDEVEPPVPDGELDDVVGGLEALEYPVTAAEVVQAVGDRELDSGAGTLTVAELVPETREIEFEDPAVVRTRIERPAIAASMKRIVEAAETLPEAALRGSQRKAYERTLRELAAIDAVDEDEGIAVVTDWIEERIRKKQRLPASRAVRKQAAKFCRENGYEVRNDEWLGA